MQAYKSVQFLLYFFLPLYAQTAQSNLFNVDNPSLLTLNIENDSLHIENQDKDYTFAIDVNYSVLHNKKGGKPRGYIAKINEALHQSLFSETASIAASSLSTGLFGFTAKIKSVPNTYIQERPYASILYFSFANYFLRPKQNQGVKYTLSAGFLGLNILKHLQNAYHQQVGFNTLNGWQKQLSKGGEPTIKFAIEWQQRLLSNKGRFSLSQSFESSIGFITEVNHSLYARLGKLSSPWWHQQSAEKNYGEKHFGTTDSSNETYLSLGIFNKLRLYNVFLQGQFKSRKQALHFTDLRSHVYGFWIGFEQHFQGGFKLAYKATYQSSEIKHGRANRAMRWGGISVSQRL